MMNLPNMRVLLSGKSIPWYLSGGISAANCVAAYQPKGAASLAASYINLAKPGMCATLRAQTQVKRFYWFIGTAYAPFAHTWLMNADGTLTELGQAYANC